MMIGVKNYMNKGLGLASEIEIQKCLISLVGDDKNLYKLGQDFELDTQKVLIGDIFFPKGIEALKINTPLLIEIKRGLLISNYSIELRKGKSYINKYPDHKYWVIYANSTLKVPKEDTDNVKFLSFNELMELAEKPKSSDSVKWTSKDQDEILCEAAKSLRETICSFILGAGVSVDAGSPSWNNLLKNLLRNISAQTNS